MEKIKVYTLSMGGTTLYAEDTKIILDHLDVEMTENIKEDEPLEFEFGVKFMTQKEIDDLGEFDGF